MKPFLVSLVPMRRAACAALAVALVGGRCLGAIEDVHVTVITPVPLVPQLNAVRPIDAKEAVAVGEHGAIARTDDAGLTWKQMASGTERALKAVAVDGCNGVAVGESGTILRTATAGASWTRVESGTSEELRGVAFGRDGVVFAVGAAGVILRSENRGTTWRAMPSGTRDTLRAVTSLDHCTAIAVGEGGTVLLTRDGGSHWEARRSDTWTTLRAVHFIDAKRGIAVGGDDRRWMPQQIIIRTNDAGRTWTRQRSPGDARLYSISGDAKALVASGEQGTVIRSTDAGLTWKVLPALEGKAWLGGMALGRGGRGLVVGAGLFGVVFRSEDAGETWKPVRKGEPGNLAAVARPAPGVVLLVNLQRILRSTDGGATFAATDVDKELRRNFQDLAIIDGVTAVAVGDRGTIVRSTDGGKSWDKVESGTRRGLTKVAFADAVTGVAVGAFGNRGVPALIRTTNGGRTWTPLEHVENAGLWSVAFHGREAGAAVGGMGTILWTRDAGETWTRVGRGLTGALLRGVAVLDARTAVVVGHGGTILRTTDAGASWTNAPSGTEVSFFAVSFSDADFGVAVGNGIMRTTSDGGRTWHAPPQFATLPLASVTADRDGAYAVGAASLLVRIDRVRTDRGETIQ